MKSLMNKPGLIFIPILSALFLFPTAPSPSHGEDERIIVHGEHPVVIEIEDDGFEDEDVDEAPPLIDYKGGEGYKEKALIEAAHFLNANVYGYTFLYKPGSTLMKTEEVFALDMRGEIGMENLSIHGEGVRNNVYRVKLEFVLTPSVKKWLGVFNTSNMRLTESEGTSEFNTGWEGRSDAYREALRNLVLIAAKRKLSSKPMLIKGDILIKGTPQFSVGAGRHYCKISGYVNFVEVVTYD
jgi:hypothetical protein